MNIYNNRETPIVHLISIFNTRIGSFVPHHLNLTINKSDFSEVSFEVPYYYVNDTTKYRYVNPLYDYIETSRVIYISNIGYFQIISVGIESDGYTEVKKLSGYSLEYELTQKYMDELDCNYVLHNNYESLKDKTSLLSSVLKDTDWTVGNISEELASVPILLDIDRTSKYDIINTEIRNFLDAENGCDIIFNYNNKTVNFYRKGANLKETGITLTFDNLMQNAEVSYNEDDIKTSLKVEGNDISINALNGGTSVLVNLLYYATDKWMGRDLAEKYKQYYQALYGAGTTLLSYYTEITKYLDLFELRLNYLNSNMPKDGQHYFQKLSFDAQQSISNMTYNSAYNAANKDCDDIINWGLDGYGIEYGYDFMIAGQELLADLIESVDTAHQDDETEYFGLKTYYERYAQIYSYQTQAQSQDGHCYTECFKIERVIQGLKQLLERLTCFCTYEHFQTPDSILNTKQGTWAFEKTFTTFFGSDDYETGISTLSLKQFAKIWEGGTITGKSGTAYVFVSEEDTSANTWIRNLIQALYKYSLDDIETIVEEFLAIDRHDFFTADEILALKRLESEDEYVDNNFSLLEDDNNAVLLEKSGRLMKNGLNKLQDISQPLLSFSTDIANPYMIKMFKPLVDNQKFDIDCKLNVVLRNHYSLTVSINRITIDYENPDNFSFTCSNILRGKLTASNYMKRLGKAYRYTLQTANKK